MAQSVRHPTSALLMISWFMSSSPPSGCVLTVWSLLGILSPPLSLPLACSLSLSLPQKKRKEKKNKRIRGAWVAQPVRHPTSALVMISWFMRSSPTPGYVLTIWSLLGILSPPLSLPLPCSLSQKKKKTKQKKHKRIRGAWVAQSVRHPTSALVTISWFEFEPHIRLHANGAEPAWDSLSLCHFATCVYACARALCLSLSLSR